MNSNNMKIASFGAISNKALQSNTLPTRIKLMDFGVTQTLDDPVIINEKSLRVFSRTQARNGRNRVPLDYNHNSVPQSAAYEAEQEPRKIAAYATPVLTKDGLFLEDIIWTPSGKENALNYEDLSPALLLDDDGVMVGIHSAALTPAGAIDKLTFYSANNNIIDFEECFEEDDDLTELSADDHYSKYGDVAYADKENHKYPINTVEHVRAAWSYINMPKNADKYNSQQLSTIKDNIKAAAKKFGININGDKTKTMSADQPVAADITQKNKSLKNMNDKIKMLAAELGIPAETDEQKVLDQFLVEYRGLKAGNVTQKPVETADKPKEFSAEIASLVDRIKVLEQDKESNISRYEAQMKQTIVSEASKEGKIVPFSAEELSEVSVKVLQSVVSKLPKNKVPLNQTTKVLSADATKSQLKGLEKTAAALNEQLAVNEI
jgi:hypothetical protein